MTLGQYISAGADIRTQALLMLLKRPVLQVRTRAVTLGQHISAGADIRAEALRLLRMELPLDLRLMGIRMSSFFQVPHGAVCMIFHLRALKCAVRQGRVWYLLCGHIVRNVRR